MLILRDCFLGLSRFEQFIASSGMTRHILADRLKRLVEAGVLERKAYTTTPKRFDYVLTEKGQEFAAPDLQRDIVERVNFTVGLGNVADANRQRFGISSRQGHSSLGSLNDWESRNAGGGARFRQSTRHPRCRDQAGAYSVSIS